VQEPNGKTLFVLSKYPHLRQLYVFYCCAGVAHERCHRLKRSLAEPIIKLQRNLQELALVTEGGQKLTPASGIAFDFGGQMRNNARLGAVDYLDLIASFAERIPPECFDMLELIATTLMQHREALPVTDTAYVK
jgi:hypothetical protein